MNISHYPLVIIVGNFDNSITVEAEEVYISEIKINLQGIQKMLRCSKIIMNHLNGNKNVVVCQTELLKMGLKNK
jgi:hypothetical protein